MSKKIAGLPTVLTSFAYGSEFFAQLEVMLVTASKHHPDWPIVTGRGPVPSFELPTLDVETPSGSFYWSIPFPLDLDGSADAWRKVNNIKAWWIAQVWHKFGGLAGGDRKRVIWVAPGGRLTGPLDIELEPEAEVVSGPWRDAPDTSNYHHHLCSGLLIFQGAKQGIVESILDEWSSICASQIDNRPYIPHHRLRPDGGEEVLTKLVRDRIDSDGGLELVKLSHDRYCDGN